MLINYKTEDLIRYKNEKNAKEYFKIVKWIIDNKKFTMPSDIQKVIKSNTENNLGVEFVYWLNCNDINDPYFNYADNKHPIPIAGDNKYAMWKYSDEHFEKKAILDLFIGYYADEYVLRKISSYNIYSYDNKLTGGMIHPDSLVKMETVPYVIIDDIYGFFKGKNYFVYADYARNKNKIINDCLIPYSCITDFTKDVKKKFLTRRLIDFTKDYSIILDDVINNKIEFEWAFGKDRAKIKNADDLYKIITAASFNTNKKQEMSGLKRVDISIYEIIAYHYSVLNDECMLKLIEIISGSNYCGDKDIGYFIKKFKKSIKNNNINDKNICSELKLLLELY